MTDLVNQSSVTPTRKVTGVMAAGALVTLGVWIASQFGIDVPGATVSAANTLILFGAGYLTKERA